MSFAQRLRSSTATPSDGSRTITVTPTPATDVTSSAPPNTGSLKLRGAHRKPQVAWTDDTVDNEGCGRKSSKICCIYHKPKRFDESSDEDSSSDEEGRHSHSRTCNHKHAEVSAVEEPPEPNAYETDPSKKGKGKA